MKKLMKYLQFLLCATIGFQVEAQLSQPNNTSGNSTTITSSTQTKKQKGKKSGRKKSIFRTLSKQNKRNKNGGAKNKKASKKKNKSNSTQITTPVSTPVPVATPVPAAPAVPNEQGPSEQETENLKKALRIGWAQNKELALDLFKIKDEIIKNAQQITSSNSADQELKTEVTNNFENFFNQEVQTINTDRMHYFRTPEEFEHDYVTGSEWKDILKRVNAETAKNHRLEEFKQHLIKLNDEILKLPASTPELSHDLTDMLKEIENPHVHDDANDPQPTIQETPSSTQDMTNNIIQDNQGPQRNDDLATALKKKFQHAQGDDDNDDDDDSE